MPWCPSLSVLTLVGWWLEGETVLNGEVMLMARNLEVGQNKN